MNIDEMWDLYDEVDEKQKPKIEDLIMSIADIYLSGLFAGTELVEKMNLASCFVYFIVCEEMVKIGVSDDVPKRLKQLQTASPKKMEIIHVIPFKDRKEAYKEEARLHAKYSSSNLGGEWFDKYEVIEKEIMKKY